METYDMSSSPNESYVLQKLLDNASATEMCSLSDIKTTRRWDYSLPTLTTNRRFASRNTYASDEAFFNTLEHHNKGFTHKLLSKLGVFDEGSSQEVVLYGGSLLDIVLQREDYIKDFDLRLVGSKFVNNEERCVVKAKEVTAAIFDFLKEENKQIDEENKERLQEEGEGAKTAPFWNIKNVKVARVRSTVTIIIPPRYLRENSTTIQLTFAPFESVKDLLAHCTPHCSRMAIWNKTVCLDQIARYCIESLCVVLNTKAFEHCITKKAAEEGEKEENDEDVSISRDIRTEVKRVIKYYEEKNMDIILPDLDLTKVPTRNLKFMVSEVLDMPNLTVIYNKILGKKVMVTDLRLPIDDGSSSTTAVSSYDETTSFDVGPSIHHNIRCMVNGVLDKFQFVAEGEVYQHIFDFAPQITPRMIDKSYETVKESLMSGTIEINKLLGYFSTTDPVLVLEILISEPIKKKAKKPGKLPDSFRIDEDKLDELINKETKTLKEMALSIKETMKGRQGLDRLVVQATENISSKEDVLNALYGPYLASR